jgi:hypothetical protein
VGNPPAETAPAPSTPAAVKPPAETGVSAKPADKPPAERDLGAKVREDWTTIKRDVKAATEDLRAGIRRFVDWISP